MRYTTSQYGEYVRVLARFQASRASGSITVRVFDLNDNSEITPSGNIALEVSGGLGVYRWDSSALSPQPTTQTEMLVVFTDSVTGRVSEQKVVLGGFPDEIAVNEYGGKITIDPVSGTAGTAFPIGTPRSPVNNVTDAKVIADNVGFKEYCIRGHIILTSDHVNWSFCGQSSVDYDTIDISGYNVYGSRFTEIRVSGAIGGTSSKLITANDSIIDNVTGWDGIINNGAIDTYLKLATGGKIQVNNARAINKITPVLGAYVDMNGAHNMQWANCAGLLTIYGLASPGIIQLSSDGTVLTLSGNTGGFTTLGGLIRKTSHSSDNTISLVDETLNRAFFGDAPWDENITQHLSSNTTGRYLYSASLDSRSGSIASSVWNAQRDNHVTAGTFGKSISLSASGFAADAVTKIDTELSAQHGTGSWQTATTVESASIASAVWEELRNNHTTVGTFGESIVLSASGFAADAVTKIDTELTLQHGAGSWQSGTFANGDLSSSIASVQNQVDKIDLAATLVPSSVISGSLMDRILNKDSNKTYNSSTDSLEAIKDRIG